MLDEVAATIRSVGRAEVVPRFRSLGAADIDEKEPGDYVTIADRACERVLSAELRAIRDVPVVGEEATGGDPTLTARIESSEAVWIVDPIDGTSNFVAGSTDFVVMVAFAQHGLTTASWIWHPATDRMLAAELHSGAWSDGQRLGVDTEPRDPRVGIAKRRYIPEPQRAAVRAHLETVELGDDRGCAGLEYSDLVDGVTDFVFYWKTKPWDHAPGTLIAVEAGLRVGRLDASPYRPGDSRAGLLTARPDRFDELATGLLRSVESAL